MISAHRLTRSSTCISGKCVGCVNMFPYSVTCDSDKPLTCKGNLQVINNQCGCAQGSTRRSKSEYGRECLLKRFRMLTLCSDGAYSCSTCAEYFGDGAVTCGNQIVFTCGDNWVRDSGLKSCKCNAPFVADGNKCACPKGYSQGASDQDGSPTCIANARVCTVGEYDDGSESVSPLVVLA